VLVHAAMIPCLTIVLFIDFGVTISVEKIMTSLIFSWTLLKDVVGFLKPRADQRRMELERSKFDHDKQDFMMEVVNNMRSSNVTQLGVSAPAPGTNLFAICEALTSDGFLERNILEGKYFVKSSYTSNLGSLY
jgi:hypothetical protein